MAGVPACIHIHDNHLRGERHTRLKCEQSLSFVHSGDGLQGPLKIKAVPFLFSFHFTFIILWKSIPLFFFFIQFNDKDGMPTAIALKKTKLELCHISKIS